MSFALTVLGVVLAFTVFMAVAGYLIDKGEERLEHGNER